MIAAHVRAGEVVRWSARPSLVGLLPILASAALTSAGLVATTYYGIEEPGVLLTGAPAFALAVLGILAEAARRFVRLRFTTFAITDERVYEVTSFFTTRVRAVPLSRATHVELRQGLFGRALGFWSGEISLYDTGPDAQTRAIRIPAIRDGPGLLQEMSAGLRRGANVAWLRRGD